MAKHILTAFLILVISASGSNVLIYDPPTGRVVAYLLSVNTPTYQGASNALINPVLPPIPLQFVKVTNGLAVAMSAAESNAVVLSILTAQTNSTRTLANEPVTAFTPLGLQNRAIYDVAVDEVNALRLEVSIAKTNLTLFQSRATLPPRTLQQFKNAVSNKINSGAVD